MVLWDPRNAPSQSPLSYSKPLPSLAQARGTASYQFSLLTSFSTSSQNSHFKRQTFHCLKSFHSLQDKVQTLCVAYSAFHDQGPICTSSHISFRLTLPTSTSGPPCSQAKQLATAVWSKVRWLKSQGLCMCYSHPIRLLGSQIPSGVLVLCSVWPSLSFLEGSPLSFVSPLFLPFNLYYSSIVRTGIYSTFFGLSH